jgi:hypothetical protein
MVVVEVREVKDNICACILRHVYVLANNDKQKKKKPEQARLVVEPKESGSTTQKKKHCMHLFVRLG